MWGKLPESLSEEQRALVEALRRVKDESGLSLQQLGRQTHYSRSSWERWLNGKRPVPVQAVAKLVELGAGTEGIVELAHRARQLPFAGLTEATDVAEQEGDDSRPAAADADGAMDVTVRSRRLSALSRALRLGSRTSATAAVAGTMVLAVLVPALGGDSPSTSVGLVKSGPALAAETAPDATDRCVPGPTRRSRTANSTPAR